MRGALLASVALMAGPAVPPAPPTPAERAPATPPCPKPDAAKGDSKASGGRLVEADKPTAAQRHFPGLF